MEENKVISTDNNDVNLTYEEGHISFSGGSKVAIVLGCMAGLIYIASKTLDVL